MRLSGQSQACLFFLRNNSEHKKSTKTQNKQLSRSPKFSSARKLVASVVFVCLFLFCSLVLVWFAFLCAQNLFVKKNKQTQSCPDNLIYYTTDMYPYQLAYQEFICTHLFLFVIICDFLSLYENRQAYEFHHLKQIFYHKNRLWYLVHLVCSHFMFSALNSCHFMSEYFFVK